MLQFLVKNIDQDKAYGNGKVTIRQLGNRIFMNKIGKSDNIDKRRSDAYKKLDGKKIEYVL
jgi:hypothetical protein